MDMPAVVSVPLRMDGTIRVGRTRVILDLVIDAYRQGATAEAIVERYPSLLLADVYLVLGYYMQNRAEIDAYLQKREAEADEIRQIVEARFPAEGLRERLLERERKKHTSWFGSRRMKTSIMMCFVDCCACIPMMSIQ
jgi:uncharacterized protein (DUF433 family)